MRKRIYEVIEVTRSSDRVSTFYDIFMMVVIALSLLPLLFKETNLLLRIVDEATVSIFILDYLLRWATADLKYGSRSVGSFLRYPFSFMAIIDLLSILPSLSILNSAFKVLRLFRLARAMRVFRVFRAFRAMRYSRSIRLIGSVMRSSRDSLAAVGTLAVAYIFISALIIFNAEPDSFDDFFEALYWATVSLTTVGYGDIYPVSTVGRAVAMVSSLFGVAVVALPSGIITAGYMRELERTQQSKAAPEAEIAPVYPEALGARFRAAAVESGKPDEAPHDQPGDKQL